MAAAAAITPAPSSRANLLEVRDLHVGFRAPAGFVEAVRGISFRIRPGTTVALVGESGSGKSVVSQAIMGILPKNGIVRQGEILLRAPGSDAPVDIAKLSRYSPEMLAIRGRNIAMIFQEPMTSLSPLHTIGNQIEEAYRLHFPGSKEEAREAARFMLERVGFPNPSRALETYPFELSGGLRQRAMIAMALICRPQLLIADEPTTALDVTIQAQILKLCKDLQAEFGMAILMITHDLGVVANMADEVVVAYQGRVMETAPLRQIFAAPKHPYLQGLIAAVPHFDMRRGERLCSLREVETGTTHLLGREAVERKAAARAAKAEQQAPILKVVGISKSYGIKIAGKPAPLAVNDVSFTVRRGECLGLVGESGCGKTTLSKIIMRALDADTGEVRYHDGTGERDLLQVEGEELRRLRKQIQFVFQDPFSALNPRMTVREILTEPLLIHRIGTAAEQEERVAELMRLVGLDPLFLSRYPHSFSGGQRQRISIARALALSPDLLILDEPVSALDVSVQAQILNLLKDLQEQLGLTYIFISHNLAVVDYMADRIAVMCAGRLVEFAPHDQLFRNPAHPYTRALLSAVPYPDPDRPLDFSALMEGKASYPAAWPEPFTITGNEMLPWIELGEGHLVRARADSLPAQAGQA
ncbi:ABC transporter ATP-binding protein [Radicibacter daui]|uniref:ABC transporter ATP-binding protein n=1 Tax=Radicibacter daui TaxID=3064829 RepID=UPI0040469E9E